VQGTEVMTVIPDSPAVFGIMYLSPERYGKIKTGQTVNIKLYDYPFDEFGVIKGTVSLKSDISRTNKYMINVSIPSSMTTTYHKKVIFKQEMRGQADIITENLKLMERIFYLMRRTR
jgi:hypothetical protein